MRSSDNIWLHRFAVLTAVATLFLICVGGLVTSHGVGMSVPDWPTTYGYNMFFFPISKWVGGIFYEHSHRLVASAVGVLTIILAVWLALKEERGWLRAFGWLALVAVVFQGVLGGLRVTALKDEIGIFHAALAQLFLVLISAIALFTSRWWVQPANASESVSEKSLSGSTGDPPVPSGDSPDGTAATVRTNGDSLFARLLSTVPVGGSPTGAGESPALPIFQTGSENSNRRREEVEPPARISPDLRLASPQSGTTDHRLRTICLSVSVLILFQLLLGATMRHEHAGLAIPDFPMAYGKLWPKTDAASVARYNQARGEVTALNPITGFQIGLQMAHRIAAAAIVIAVAWATVFTGRRLGWACAFSKISMSWLALIATQVLLGIATIWTNKSADIATAHVAVGALSLVTGVILSLMAGRSAVMSRQPAQISDAAQIHAEVRSRQVHSPA